MTVEVTQSTAEEPADRVRIPMVLRLTPAVLGLMTAFLTVLLAYYVGQPKALNVREQVSIRKDANAEATVLRSLAAGVTIDCEKESSDAPGGDPVCRAELEEKTCTLWLKVTLAGVSGWAPSTALSFTRPSEGRLDKLPGAFLDDETMGQAGAIACEREANDQVARAVDALSGSREVSAAKGAWMKAIAEAKSVLAGSLVGHSSDAGGLQRLKTQLAQAEERLEDTLLTEATEQMDNDQWQAARDTLMRLSRTVEEGVAPVALVTSSGEKRWRAAWRRCVEHRMNQELTKLEAWADGGGKASSRLERRTEQLLREATLSTKPRAHKRTAKRLKDLYSKVNSVLASGLLERVRKDMLPAKRELPEGVEGVQEEELDAELSRRERALRKRLEAARTLTLDGLGQAVLVRLSYALTRGSKRDLMTYYGQVRADGWREVRRPYTKREWGQLMRGWKKGMRKCVPAVSHVRLEKSKKELESEDVLSFNALPGCEAHRAPSRLSFEWREASKNGFVPTQHWSGQ